VFQLIEKLRKKPEAARNRIAILTAAAITVIIFLVWLSVLGVRVDNTEENTANAGDSASPISILGDNIADIIENVKSQINALKEGIENIIQ
jgi:amino acid permease